jgi:4-amino-4-deoxy-L-arabinose transferase-like glycosyltransferase
MSTTREALLLALLFVLCFLGLDRDLWTPDEPREAEIAREMWLAPSVVPSLNGRDFIEKPPLYYWTVASVFAAVGPSAAAARSVSAAASFLTLCIVYFWGRREFSSRVGATAALGLATSAQFMISSHWIVMDPLLMLCTTASLWAAFDLMRGRGGRRALLVFYGALTLALWTKGLIGPVLVACGLIAYAVARRSLDSVWRVRPYMGLAVLGVMTGAIAASIYFQSGGADVREWLWVNHVQRFLDPTYTGHDQPFFYYLSAVLIALFPWWVPFASVFKPSGWRAAAARPTRDVEVFAGAVSLGMVLILSAAATKRAVYLLPVLPPLFLLLAARAEAWWQRSERPSTGPAWWLQTAFVVLFATTPTVAVLVYFRLADAAAAVYLGAVLLIAVALVVFARRADHLKALAVVAATAVTAVVGLVVVDTRLAAPLKDMTPFVAWIDEQIPRGSSLTVTGNIDETLYGIVPFVTEDPVVFAMPSDIPALGPRYVLVQDKNGGRTAPQLPAPYELLAARHFGPGRYLALWERSAATTDSRTVSPVEGRR